MRELTIRRNKSFVGCLAKMKVYVEDPEHGNVVIRDTFCRKLGSLENGEEKVFSVPCSEVKIFVIADRLSKNYCCELYQLPEGQEPVMLSGKNEFSLAAGNAFRFENNPSEEALASRKQGKKIGIIVLIVALLVGFGIGFGVTVGIGSLKDATNTTQPTKAPAKTFEVDVMRIVLTEEFRKFHAPQFAAAWESEHVAVMVQKEEAGNSEISTYTAEKYAQAVIDIAKVETGGIQKAGEWVYFEYDNVNPATEEEFHYVAYVIKEKNTFWLVQFATRPETAQSYREEIKAWVESITFEYPRK